MTLPRLLAAGLALSAMALLTGCYYPAPPPAAYAPSACASVVNPDGTTSTPANCYYAPYAYSPYPYYYPYPAYYYPPYYSPYYYGPPIAVGVGFGFGFHHGFR